MKKLVFPIAFASALALSLVCLKLYSHPPEDSNASQESTSMDFNQGNVTNGQSLPAPLADYVQSLHLNGKPLIVEFWATFCPPCRQSIPHLNKIFEKNKDRGLAILGITTDDQATVAQFRGDIPIDYTVGYDSGAIMEALQIEGIPYAYVLNSEGKVVWQGHPLALTDAEVAKAFGKGSASKSTAASDTNAKS